MLSLDEPLDLKITSSRDRAFRTSICAPLRFARAQTLRLTHSPNADKDVLHFSSSTLDRSLSPSSPSSPPSPQHSSSSCSPLLPPLARDLETFNYQEDGASPPLGFQFFLPIGAGSRLRLPSSVLIGQHQERQDSPEPGDEQLACRWLKCHLLFECLQDLVDHVTEFHVKPERRSGYCCHWEGCARKGRGFNARYKMLIHIRTHTNEKPHQCPICSKSFSRLENLKIHTRSHTGEKPYVCPYEGCSKRYSNSSDRFKHTRTHYEDRPYCCKMTGCHKRYTDPSSLRKHIKAHGHAVTRVPSMSAGKEPLTAHSPSPGGGLVSDLLNPPLSHLASPGATLAFLGAHALHSFNRPLIALETTPLDLSTPPRLPVAGAVLCHSLGVLGMGRTPLVRPLVLPSFGLRETQCTTKENEDNDDNDDTEAGHDASSWVFAVPDVMLKQAVVS